MIKLVALLKGSPHLSRNEVIDYYERHHAPLICSIIQDILEYRRSYLSEAIDGRDILTELLFADYASYERAMAAASTAEAAKRIGDDEARFLDRSATKLILADERRELSPHACRLGDDVGRLQIGRCDHTPMSTARAS